MSQIISIDSILISSSTEVAQSIDRIITDPILTKCETIDDLNQISEMLPKLVNLYSFFMSIESMLKAKNRELKRTGDKEAVADIVDKTFIVHNACEVIKMKQKTLSRLITIKQMVNDEIHMI